MNLTINPSSDYGYSRGMKIDLQTAGPECFRRVPRRELLPLCGNTRIRAESRACSFTVQALFARIHIIAVLKIKRALSPAVELQK
jgi:hypothetical protein